MFAIVYIFSYTFARFTRRERGVHIFIYVYIYLSCAIIRFSSRARPSARRCGEDHECKFRPPFSRSRIPNVLTVSSIGRNGLHFALRVRVAKQTFDQKNLSNNRWLVFYLAAQTLNWNFKRERGAFLSA